MKNFIEKTFKLLSSLRLAVVIIIAVGVLSAIGTIVEARFDAEYAQKLVYHSPYMYFVLALLCINLFSVMVDRLPWKRHHTGFILAHIGIIVLVIGSILTRYYGIDGSIAVDINKSNRYVMLNGTEVSVYASFGQDGYRRLAYTDRDFLVFPPDEPVKVSIGQKTFEVIDYIHYAVTSEKLVESQSPHDPPAIRINLQNDRANVTDWIMISEDSRQNTLSLGPASIKFTRETPAYAGMNEIYLQPIPNSVKLNYYIFTQSKNGLTGKGTIEEGGVVDVGWMGLKLRALRYYQNSRKDVQFIDNIKPNKLTRPAIKFRFDGKEHWLALNDNMRIFSDNTAFLVAFNNKRINLGFDIHLDKFTMGLYQGTQRAASYSSDVSVEGNKFHISMNDPLKYDGYTFYQASFQRDPATNEATTSIFSVNKDPGRWIKYLGSLLIVLGSLVMFYFKRAKFKILFKKGKS